jgi:prophage regulatory protein
MQFIRANDVARLIGVSKVTLWRMVRAGRFPAPVTVNVGSKAYVLEEVQEWMAAAVSRRTTPCPRSNRAQRR